MAIPLSLAHVCSPLQVNSGPLSARNARGRRPCSESRFNTLITPCPDCEKPTVSMGHVRSHKSIRVNMRIDRPSARLSCTKSIARHSFGPETASSGLRGSVVRCFLLRRRRLNLSSLYIRSVRLWFTTRPSCLSNTWSLGAPKRFLSSASSRIRLRKASSLSGLFLRRAVARLTHNILHARLWEQPYLSWR